jgi:hypothetical protein
MSRTVDGLLTELRCEDKTAEGWNWSNDPLIHHASYELWTERKEGNYSIRFLEERPSGPGESTAENSAMAPVMVADGMRLHCWHKVQVIVAYYDSPHNRLSIQDGNGNPHIVFDVRASDAWTFKKATVAAAPGNGYLEWANWHAGAGECRFSAYLDHVVLSLSQYVVVTGLIPGQKIEIYRASDDVKIAEGTCQAGQTQASVDVDAEEYPEYMYMKVYASDGVTLIEATPSYKMCGGDTWAWVSPEGTLTVTGIPYIFYREGAVATPKSATVTATLKTEVGDPAPGKTIYFSCSFGSVDPVSAETNEDGEAETTLTSAVQGIAMVKCNWPGDADIPAAVAYSEHHVFYDAETGDPDKKFQLYIEGKEFSYIGGEYAISTETTPQEFSVEIPEWSSDIVPRGLVAIYRLGVKEYSGILTKTYRNVSENPRVALSGTDSKSLLEAPTVTLSDYSDKTLTEIVTSLLAAYPSAVSAGEIETYPNALTIAFADESLVSSISRLVGLIGWLYRVTADRLLDVKSSFGLNKPATQFVYGTSLFRIERTDDYSQVENMVRMRGNDALVSTAFDGPSIESIGKIGGVAFQKTITDQSTLDIAAQAELERMVGTAIKIGGDVLDDYDPGSWGLDDWITLTCSDLDLSGIYKVILVRRDMRDPSFAHVECANKAAYELGDLFEKLKRQLKDLNVS